MGEDGRNLDDLDKMTGHKHKLYLCQNYDYLYAEGLTTSSVENLNNLVLKYANKTHVYRFEMKFLK